MIRHLESIAELSGADKQAIGTLPLTLRSVGADEEIVHEGDVPEQCCLLLDGFMHRYKVVPNGERQILSLHLPGEIPDLLSLHLPKMDHSLGTLTPSRIAMIPHGALRDISRAHPGIAEAFWRDTLIDASIFREWIVNVGRRGARERIAHLFCEMFIRSRLIGLAGDGGFELRLTQGEIGEATGLTPVHVNRTLQDLRKSGLIASEGRFLRILDWTGLRRAGGFDAAYLHLKRPEEP